MSGSERELAPGTIAGIAIGTLLILVVLSATGIILHHRRRIVVPDTPSSFEKPTPLSKTPQRRTRRPPLRKASPRLSVEHISLPMPLARAKRDCEKDRDRANTSVSTLNVIISPSLPRVFKLDMEGGESAAVEVRVTPPTPVASRGDMGMPSPTRGRASRKTRLGGTSGVGLGIQASTDSRRWMM
ncbi:hypothetical protein DAEQUDRAFT_813460 [Daedalea quercina L-15889]|uniref:Uncharacterized protein n=1 Tax=Daedalea quercina L-15889 TaxID=1314783 RepID=A0A165N5A4_9APHY|nr:hypothetical protein DAEQUDRAFT_813460 [Daedalea quercina L-15889]